jgi:hypothetical protein|tara:strand:+ start:10001 stop:10774 length:774 start_codon:yes stop_codon:yes gene_type:complete
MYRFLFLSVLFLSSCKEINSNDEQVNVDLNNKSYYASFTKDEGLQKNNVEYSEKGASFLYSEKPSYLLLDSLKINKNNEINISFWFQFTGDDPKNEQMLFSICDSVKSNKNINFWIAGRRLTAKINSNNLWAKEYNYEKGGSRMYYDLFQLELGKFYFLSINITEDKAEVFINSELYVSYKELKDASINMDQMYLGTFHDVNDDFKYQFQGYIRNLTIYNKTLNNKEIKTLSQEAYQEIFPYNDAFELSKFKTENFE